MPIPLAAETGTVSPFLAFLRSPWGILLCWLLLRGSVRFLWPIRTPDMTAPRQPLMQVPAM